MPPGSEREAQPPLLTPRELQLDRIDVGPLVVVHQQRAGTGWRDQGRLAVPGERRQRDGHLPLAQPGADRRRGATPAQDDACSVLDQETQFGRSGPRGELDARGDADAQALPVGGDDVVAAGLEIDGLEEAAPGLVRGPGAQLAEVDAVGGGAGIVPWVPARNCFMTRRSRSFEATASICSTGAGDATSTCITTCRASDTPIRRL